MRHSENHLKLEYFFKISAKIAIVLLRKNGFEKMERKSENSLEL